MPDFPPPDLAPILPEDVPAIAALARRIWEDAYSSLLPPGQIDYMLAQRYDHDRLLAEIGNPQKWWVQAFLGDFRAGFACSEIQAGESGPEFKLDKLYVHPEAQRRGIGRALVAHAVETAKEQGFDRLILAVNKQNTRALQAYARYGFTRRASTVTDIGGGYVMDDYIMEKRFGCGNQG
ncbi:MAG: GNAT family N-acetyltransferase [Zoogloeaceae bacterium]|jgi:ribosomal protein S18 acetylase RimI-like enzyme|nr:GNAT family N-acetyltransferase [Zoogloeaceae bacterium]